MIYTCFEWESIGISCSHAIAVILFHKKNPQTYTQAFLSLDEYHKIYANIILSLNVDILYNKLVFVFLSPQNDDNNIERDILVSSRVNCLLERSRIHRICNDIEDLFENKWVKRYEYYGKFEYAMIICDSVI